ncbi:hypothetical protein EZ428_21810 [Pedobacter frigiditerrae]|uniref:Uncharacterized protein n=1 Tax=Pedobacter frigiditerrae TaxID=2530452 RepID=A0A4V2MHQ0_9SPHI|nr:hypothetical protein [Pedobacter frigiditerrae]TCC87336.1 hypothetical protein EZ428_21810 [Pedobacter frigiditerrae]
MYSQSIFKLTSCLALVVLPLIGLAMEIEQPIGRINLMHKSFALKIDSIKPQQEKQDEKNSKSKTTAKTQEKKPEIATVPKSRKQMRPTVVKPKVIVKPIKVIKPKIKKP